MIEKGHLEGSFLDEISGLRIIFSYEKYGNFAKKTKTILVDIYDMGTKLMPGVQDKIAKLFPEIDVVGLWGNPDSFLERHFSGENPKVNPKTKKVPKILSMPGLQLSKDLIEPHVLEMYCRRPTQDFWIKNETTKTAYGNYRFIDNNSSVLAVAHLDTVFTGNSFPFTVDGDQINSYNLDDRLGAYIIMEVLPKLGINADILLTEGEESGLSTAMFFEPTKKYNWIFQFDRMGTDVVLYQYETQDQLCNSLENDKFFINYGSFSDISFMNIGVAGVNFGTGYYDNHFDNSYMLISHTLLMIGKFVEFYKKHKNTKYKFSEYKKHEHKSKFYDLYGFDGQDLYGFDGQIESDSWYLATEGKFYFCINCGYESKNPEDLIFDLCENCYNYLSS